MKNIDIKKVLWLIKKELNLYFNSPIAYIVISIFLLLLGFFYSRPLFVQNYATLRHVFDITPLFFLFFIPAITMRLYSEEYKSGTIEVIFTLPVRKSEILLAKYLSAVCVIFISIILTLLYPVTLLFFGKFDIGQTIAGYFGVLFLSLFFSSIGVFSSSLTKNQIVSFVISFAIMFIFFMLGKLGVFVSSTVAYIGIDPHYDNFVRGIVDVRDIVYFLSLTGLFLYFTYLSTTTEK
jgi:ABC-2 type transport system permease protein